MDEAILPAMGSKAKSIITSDLPSVSPSGQTPVIDRGRQKDLFGRG
jgi:hypothetical protein